jgi:hypothetical protein
MDVNVVRIAVFCATSALVALSACDGVPEVVFSATDGAAVDATVGKDGATSSADGSTGGMDGGKSGVDGSTPGTDGGSTDAGKDAGKDSGVDSGVYVCVPGGKTDCCSNQPCINCPNQGKCNSCPADCANPTQPVCCYDNQGNGTLTCQALSQPCP